MNSTSQKVTNYNKLTDEQAQATYDYPKLDESQVVRNENFSKNQKEQNIQNKNEFPLNQNLPSYNLSASNNQKPQIQPQSFHQNLNNYQVPPPPPPPQYINYNQQNIVYPMPANINNPQYQEPVFQAQNIENTYEELEIGNRNPVEIICPSCGGRIETFVKHKIGLGTNFSAMVLCFVGGSCFLCLVPYFIKRCQDAVHYCPLCNARIGTSAFLC